STIVMESLLQYVAPPSRCGYLPDQLWQLEYEYVASMTPAEYMQRMLDGWRRFGSMVFRPRCQACSECKPLRIVVDRFRPDRSQRRARNMNDGTIRLRIGPPTVSAARLALYDRYHSYQAEAKGWPVHPGKDAWEYAHSFVDNPFPTEEWCYFLGNKLIAVGYVDVLPAGLSAIYFYYDPAERERSLGTWNILSIIDRAAQSGIPHVYLGYYVSGCGSMLYKARFKPNQIRCPDGVWRDFEG
ncbi:MAG TPA: arginyltransferase, partial [Gemmataceae bacterium]|nr:arginyltransferase [Gemmataceae bacterium]